MCTKMAPNRFTKMNPKIDDFHDHSGLKYPAPIVEAKKLQKLLFCQTFQYWKLNYFQNKSICWNFDSFHRLNRSVCRCFKSQELI